MAGLNIPGLATGLDSASIIKQLMAVEANPQTLLKQKVTGVNSKITDMTTLNGKLATLTTQATKLSGTDTLKTFTATTSSENVTATASGATAEGSLTFTVDKLAAAQTSVTKAWATWPDLPPVVTFVAPDGTKTVVTASSASMAEMAAAINGSSAGVSASRVAIGTDASGNTLYRLQLTSKTSGAAGGFQAYRGDATTTPEASLTNLLTEPGAATIQSAQDAQITLYKGTAAETALTSKTNVFADIMPGVTATVAKASTDPVTVSVSSDQAATTASVKTMVENIASTIAFIKSQSASTKTKDASGNAITKSGTFTTDSLMRGLSQQLASATQGAVNGTAPSTIGISFDKAGVLSFDEAAFTKALADNPTKVESIVAGLSARVADVAKGYSATGTGLLTNRITSEQSNLSMLNTQVDKWDDRLAIRKATLERTYTALETAISKLNSQSSFLSSQLSSLTTNSTSK